MVVCEWLFVSVLISDKLATLKHGLPSSEINSSSFINKVNGCSYI